MERSAKALARDVRNANLGVAGENPEAAPQGDAGMDLKAVAAMGDKPPTPKKAKKAAPAKAKPAPAKKAKPVKAAPKAKKVAKPAKKRTKATKAKSKKGRR